LDIATSSNNLLQVNGGTLRVQNLAGTGTLDVRSGTNRFDSGLIDVDRLVLTNTRGVFEFNGGTLVSKGTSNSNGRVFTVGKEASPAAFQLQGGTHTFANNLVISSNATLSGNGTIVGTVTNLGTLSPGTSAGSLRIHGSLNLAASAGMFFEIGGLMPTNQYDQLTVTNFVQFAGTLSLALLNNFLPDDSDSFTLLSFGSASGAFTNAPNGGRVDLTNNLASFAVTYTSNNLVLSDVSYVDSDGDRMGDLQEQLAGTNPNDPGSVLIITSITEDMLGRYVIRFQSVAGKNYEVQYSNDLVLWSAVVGATFTEPAPGAMEWIDDGTLTGGLPATRSYRVRLVVP
jgi:hypothetical protein